MFGRWLAAHKSVFATITSGTIVAAIVVVSAVVSAGFTAQKMDLNDGSVWVANDSQSVIGRANPQVLELNSVVRSQGGTDLETVQNSSTVLLVDRSNASMAVIDPSTSEAGDTIALPPQQPEVWLAGSNVVIMAQGTGQVWIVPATGVQSFDPSVPAPLNFGKGAVATVDGNGMLYAYGPQSSQAFEVDAGAGAIAAEHWDISFPATAKAFGITAVAGQWSVLDATDRIVATVDGRTSLTDAIGAGTHPVLQVPSTTGSRVLIASDTGLVSMPLAGGSPSTLVAAVGGTAAAPISVGSCSYAAWSVGDSWRQCGSATATRTALKSLSTASKLVFAANGNNVVLNDARSGDTWAVQLDGGLINNWSQLVKNDDQQQQQTSEDTPPKTVTQEEPPVAVDDRFGARPGRATELPVLLNDYDPNGDVIVISAVDTLPVATGTVVEINNDQELLITLPANAQGTFDFGYSINDGRGETASAVVTITVRTPGENSAPQQVRASKTTVRSGGQVTTNVLSDWFDPDGDPIFLQAASVSTPGDKVTFKPDGTVLFTDSGTGGGTKTVALQVSDGTLVGTGELIVTVRAVGQTPIIADSFVVITYASEQVTVSPLDHVRGGNATIRLNAVPAKTGVTIQPSFDSGTFTFSSTQVGSHYLTYIVTDGTQTATGQIRVDVEAPPDSNTRPITIPKTMFVPFQSSATLDVADSDIDPSGVVLLVTGVSNVPDDSGIRAEILGQADIRVTLTRPLAAPTAFTYTVSNGLSSADGSITVIQLPEPTVVQPPIARDDTVAVRVGDVIDIPVLNNDEQPDGDPVVLDSTLPKPLLSGEGLLFASGNVLRYLAPHSAGNFSAVYQISSTGPNGQVQTAQATVHITVRERDLATNNPPVPLPVTARVLAGDKVTIPIPLTGIDPDGDSVQLLGIASNPQKGSVIAVDASDIQYEAGAYSAGTDTFTYTVIDGLGARATGTIRVGIAPKSDGAQNPIAVADAVSVRPGKSVTVQVLANDSDPDGSALTVKSVKANESDVKFTIIGGQYVKVTPPRTPAAYGLVYTIANGYGGTSQAFITVTVDPNAPPARPIANDTVLTVTDVLNKVSIDVPVLNNVFFADGPVSTLGVALLPGYGDSATVLPSKKIRVTIEATSQVIPFSVSNPDDPTITAFAFIRVPGYDDALPQLNTKATPLEVRSEQTLTINLSQYVVALGGRTVQLTSSNSVSATHSNGASLVADAHTLQFTSAEAYYGPASITFEVTDGSPNDPSAHTAILTLPIKVDARDNQPPVFNGADIDLEPDQTSELSLVSLTNYPHANDLVELQYSLASAVPPGFTATINGQRLDLTAAEGTPPGTTASISIGVKDAVNTGQTGRITLTVVPSTRPLAVPLPDYVIAPRGQTTTVDVLANDQANNPFPDTPLRVIAVQGISSASLPSGVSVSPSNNDSRLSISVASNAAPGVVAVQYEVADATDSASRFTFGNVQISIQDRPDPVSQVTVTEFDDRQLHVAWQPGASNNSPITDYQVIESSPTDGHVITTQDCVSSASCSISTPGNGPSNAVQLSVVAVNSIGRSDPAQMATTIWSDIIPGPPATVSATPLNNGLTVSWTPPASNNGSAIQFYLVTVGGVSKTVPATTRSTQLQDPSITNGSATGFSVSARNSAPNTLASWNAAAGIATPAGSPQVTGTPTASTSPGLSGTGGAVVVNWAGVFNNNGRAISDYWVDAYTGTAPTCGGGLINGSSGAIPPTTGNIIHVIGESNTTANYSNLNVNQTYSVIVFAYNGQDCVGASSSPVTPRDLPPDVTSITTSALSDSEGDSTYDYAVTGVSTSADSFEYKLQGAGVDGTAYGPVALGGTTGELLTSNGSQYGASISVSVKACVTYSDGVLCSPDWSSYAPVGVPINLQLNNLLTTETVPVSQGVYSWDSAQTGPNISSIQTSCDGGNTFTDYTNSQGQGSCTAQYDLTRLTYPGLIVKYTTTAGDTEQRTYPWH